MQFDFKIENRIFEDEKIIYVQLSLPYEEMRDAYKSFMKLGIHVFSHQGRNTGPCYVKYINETPESIDVEVCLAVAELLPETEEVKTALVARYEGKFAIGTCRGAYNDIPGAYAKMKDAFDAAGLQLSGEPMIERYLNYRPHMPENELITELIWPIKL